MLDSIGKKLSQARQAQGLSIEEAAHATRIRPDKLIALEHNDYSRFGSNAYAKGFLQIYGKFLRIDVSETARLLETPKQVSISDYQYLNSAPEEPPVRQRAQRQVPSLHTPRPSIVPMVVMLVAALVIVGTGVGYWINVQSQRIESGKTAKPPASESPTVDSAAPASTPAQTSAPASAVAAEGLQDSAKPAPIASAPEPLEPQVEVRRAEPVTPPAVSATPIAPAPTPSTTAVVSSPTGINEIVVEPLKKTWVKIRKDSPTSAPIFEDYLYPGARPLVLRGSKFFVEVRDQDAVQIRKNGSPIAYQAPGISIQ